MLWNAWNNQNFQNLHKKKTLKLMFKKCGNTWILNKIYRKPEKNWNFEKLYQ